MKFNRSVYQSLTMVTQFGINMIVPIFMCSFAGWFLDKKLETNYWFIILFFIGAIAGGYNVFRFARNIYKRAPEESAYIHIGRSSKHDLSKGDPKD